MFEAFDVRHFGVCIKTITIMGEIYQRLFPDGVTTNTIPKFPSSILFARNN